MLEYLVIVDQKDIIYLKINLSQNIKIFLENFNTLKLIKFLFVNKSLETYILIKGSVLLYSKNYELITKLGESDSFCESALIMGKLRNNTSITDVIHY